MKYNLFFVGAIALAVTTTGVHAQVLPKHYPENGKGTDEFNWQEEWGTIHMNSHADNINDPGQVVTKDGHVGCVDGSKTGGNTPCDDLPASDKTLHTAIPRNNGIKYDIKNSVLGCMSMMVTNWAKNNQWDPSTTVCTSDMGLNGSFLTSSGGKYIDPIRGRRLVYLPIWDKRGNDDDARNANGRVGCQQQVINGCVRNMHECVESPSDTPTEARPHADSYVTTIFTPEQTKDLGADHDKSVQLPDEYWVYTKKEGDDKREAIARTDPEANAADYPDRVPNTKITHVRVGPDKTLSRIKSYRMAFDEGSDKNAAKFILVDPSRFFDITLYTPGAEFDSGYSLKHDKGDLRGTWATPNTCPALELKNGYSGICDPTGKAGCNLPIYKVGPETAFTGVVGKTFVSNAYPIEWSGFAKKWAVITKEQYLENIKGRENTYLTGDDINDNPIIMLTRADDYCEREERISDIEKQYKDNPDKIPVPDMPCIHYMQWGADDPDDPKDYLFVDLYYPGKAKYKTWDPEYNTLQLYHIDENGLPDYKRGPLTGTGTDIYIGGVGKKTGYVSFFDKHVKYEDKSKGLLIRNNNAPPAVWQANYNTGFQYDSDGNYLAGGPVVSTDGNPASGTFLGPWTPPSETKSGTRAKDRGTGIRMKPGSVTVIRENRTQEMVDAEVPRFKINGQEVGCIIAAYIPTKLPEDAEGLPKPFIPTNSAQELQAFIDAVVAGSGPIEGLSLRKCNAGYMTNDDLKDAEGSTVDNPAAKNGAKSWIGMTSCSQLKQKPKCNETRVISAQRWCQYETSAFANCEECVSAKDPDADYDFSKATIEAGGMAEVIIDPKVSTTKCDFKALCFAASASDCPGKHISGGHVFCFGGDTKITMADGKEKAISKIKAGEKVKTFNARHLRTSNLSTGIVKLTAVTKKQRIIKINGMLVTPLHRLVLSTGRSEMAQDIRVGDHIMMADGSIKEVTEVDMNQKPITVYNLVLDDENDGYIANGMRVMSYPLHRTMEDTRRKSRKQRMIVPATYRQ